MNENILNESVIREDMSKSLNETSTTDEYYRYDDLYDSDYFKQMKWVDMDGDELNIGDEVIAIDRGYDTSLAHGIIKSFAKSGRYITIKFTNESETQADGARATMERWWADEILKGAKVKKTRQLKKISR